MTRREIFCLLGIHKYKWDIPCEERWKQYTPDGKFEPFVRTLQIGKCVCGKVKKVYL